MDVVLEARGVGKRYGDRVILDDLSFTVARGDMVAVTGRSGSGKSTLFKLLAGLDRPSAGQVLVGGQDIAALDEDGRARLRLERIGLVFQSFNLLPDLTLAENVRLPLDIAGVPRREGNPRAQELLDLLHVGHVAHKPPHEVSGGEAQRAAIARALANRPAIVLADEPTGNLDQQNAENVLSAFLELNRTLGTTILIITHDPLVIERVPDRLELREGRLLPAAARPSAPRRA